MPNAGDGTATGGSLSFRDGFASLPLPSDSMVLLSYSVRTVDGASPDSTTGSVDVEMSGARRLSVQGDAGDCRQL